MNTYECLKNGLFFRGRRYKKGETYSEEGEPCDGKGNSLLKERNPAFALVSSGVVKKPAKELTDAEITAQSDPRTNSQIRRDIKENYGEAVDMRMKKVNLLALEKKLKMLHAKDAAIGMNDEMTLKEAEELVR